MTDSIYDQLNAYGTIAKQRFVENFSGSALDTDRWSTNNVRGTNTFAMDDSIDGGFKVTTGAGSYDSGSITFNNIRQYSQTSSVIIAVTKLTSPTVSTNYVGFTDHQDSPVQASASDGTVMENGQPNGNIRLGTSQTGASTFVATTTARTSNWITSKIEMLSSTATLSLAGVIEATVSSNLPTSPNQPHFMTLTNEAVLHIGNIRYCEAYNT